MPTAEARRRAWPALCLILSVAVALRLWGVGQGLPYVYNIDEAGHFVPKAVEMFSHGLNPHYFVNPPALTYLLHLVFAVWFGGRSGVVREYALHPDDVFLLARVTVALLGAGAVWMLYLLGARLFGRSVGLLAATVEAVAFLPVFYGHFALNDAATLLPLTLSLFGSAGVLRHGRLRDYALAGVGLGVACAGKYTAGIAVVPLVAAAASHYLASIGEIPAHSAGPLPAHAGHSAGPPIVHAGRRVLVGLTAAGACALGGFLLANPYALLDFQRFHTELIHQSSLSEEAQGKLGAPKHGGVLYYLWSFTWGLGWAPALAALGGAIAIWRRDARSGWLLVPAPVLFLAFMGLQDRYFGRWLLPIFPIACVLAAWFAAELVLRVRAWSGSIGGTGGIAKESTAGGEVGTGEVAHQSSAPCAGAVAPHSPPRARARRPLWASLLGALVVVVVLAQGVIYSVHNDLVLARADTRNLTRSWMVEHVPRGGRIVLEPVVLGSWLLEGAGSDAKRWVKYPALQSVIAPDGALAPQSVHSVALEDYETTLSPALIGWYERQGYCWVVSGSTESGRAFADVRAAPLAVAYYRALAAQARVVYRISPYASHAAHPGFSFDWTFDYYPLSYWRPGPEMTVYRLSGGRCA
jgi:4-amino-4-deoxy-L-arabinose transferase-like glycosyltransferase